MMIYSNLKSIFYLLSLYVVVNLMFCVHDGSSMSELSNDPYYSFFTVCIFAVCLDAHLPLCLYKSVPTQTNLFASLPVLLSACLLIFCGFASHVSWTLLLQICLFPFFPDFFSVCLNLSAWERDTPLLFLDAFGEVSIFIHLTKTVSTEHTLSMLLHTQTKNSSCQIERRRQLNVTA